MGFKTERYRPVEVDDRGRVTIPADVRERLGIRPGETLECVVEGDHVTLRPDHDELVTVTADRTDWGGEAFPDSGPATFGENGR